MTTTITKSQIFQSAWCTAREMAQAAGTGPKAQFAAALRATYRMVKEMQADAAADAQRQADLRNELFEELQALQAVSFGPRASAAKDSNRARRADLRAQISALAA